MENRNGFQWAGTVQDVSTFGWIKMTKLTNEEILGGILRSLYAVSSRRTTQGFAATVIGSIVKTLEQNYGFLKYVTIDEEEISMSGDVIFISPEINEIDPTQIGKAVEAIIRVVYMDLIGKAGLFFIKELKQNAGEKIMKEIKNYGADLNVLQTEQHYLYRQREKKKTLIGKGKKRKDGVSLLGYTWKSVSTWEYDPAKKVCTLYKEGGEVLDKLNLDTIVENYVKDLSEGEEEIPSGFDEDIEITDKEFQLLKMLNSRDIDAETAITLLHLTKKEFETMIHRLLEAELLQYVSFNVVELTEIGISYVTKKEQGKEVKATA